MKEEDIRREVQVRLDAMEPAQLQRLLEEEMMKDEDRLVSLKEAQRLTGIPRRTWARYVERQIVKSIRVERTGIYIPLSEILKHKEVVG